MESFKREMSLAMSLFHPNVVRTYGLTKMGCFKGILMEWADQDSLRSKLDHLSVTEKITVALGISNGLAYLHSKTVLCRDLTPQKVLLFGPDPTAKITAVNTSTIFQAWNCIYSAPELFESVAHSVKSADIYSLVSIL
jgi:serine/threonine protein kinase